jgi:hypothetical protein
MVMVLLASFGETRDNMPNGDLYEVVDKQAFLGQTCLNVYFFLMTAAPLGNDHAADVVDGFVANLLPVVAAVQSPEVTHTSVRARNLFLDSDAHESLISVAGEGTSGDTLGTFEAFPFKLVGDNAAVRPGSKRVTGVAEFVTTDGVVTNSTTLTELVAIAAIYAAGIHFGLLDAGTLVPVIVKRILDGGTYRLPANDSEAVISNVVDALSSALVTSQVSRKVGRGE